MKKNVKRDLFLLLLVTIILVSSTIAGAITMNTWISNRTKLAPDDWNANSARVYLWWANGTFGGIEKKNYIHVFAYDGDTICLGSNVYNASYNLEGTAKTNTSHNDKDSIDIVMYDSNNKPTAIDITKNGKGHIGTIAKEAAAKSMTSPAGKDGYVPYTYTVHETGVYTFEFRSYDGGSNGTRYNKQTELKEPSENTGLIAAWDITVFDENNKKKTGRVYADYLSLETSGTVKEKYYVLTSDSYIYEMTFNGISPYTFNFFANHRGLTDAATGNILYKSVKDLNNDNKFTRMGVNFKYPGTKDTDLSKSFYVFFDKPNEDLEGQLYEKALAPDPATNIRFIDTITYQDQTGQEVTRKGAYEGVGGYFAFDVKEATTATLRLEFRMKDSQGKTYEPLEISDVVTPNSTNYFYWDGRDGKGNIIPAGEYSIDELIYTVATKAGEIHFPIFDVENATDGITFTRVSNIYDREGNQLDYKGSIYDLTRSVIYYDDTAIYYGENVATTGSSESEVEVFKNNSKSTDDAGREYLQYNNFTYQKNGQYVGERALYESYAKAKGLRIGDHSHTSNIIDYTKTYEDQKALIDYLDSAKTPLAQSANSNGKSTTTDYGIANFWAFIPSEAVVPKSDDNIVIVSAKDKDIFNLNARVFFDEGNDGIYDPQDGGDHLLSGVKLNLYKETTDEILQDNKKYYYLKDANTIVSITNKAEANGKTIYELIESATTPLQGRYLFTGLEYDKTKGTKYMYQVIRPNTNYELTSGSTKPSGKETTGNYKLYAYDKNSNGTEIQEFTVGGTGVDLTSFSNQTMTAIDVGYYYETTVFALQVKKDWSIPEESKVKQPGNVIIELSYNLGGVTKVYEERVISGMQAWTKKYEFLETKLDNKQTVTDYFVSAEYYIYGDKIFRHRYSYNAASGMYESFVGDDYYFSLSEYYKSHPTDSSKPADENYEINNIPDFNQDGRSDALDIQSIPSGDWHKALAAGSEATAEDVVSPFNSVLDRNITSSLEEISITNAVEPATIEVLKYTGVLGDGHYLQGATFRIYEGTMDDVKKAIDRYNLAQAALNQASSPDAALQREFEEAAAAVDAMEIASSTTRLNGRVSFPGLSPNKTYTVRERYAPSGYRIVEEFFQVNPKGSSLDGKKFNDSNYVLLEVGNAEASGEIEIRKKLLGRAWQKTDSFNFDIVMDSSNVTIDSYDQSLYSVDDIDLSAKVSEFVNKFSTTKDTITINNESPYTKLNGVESPDTKSYLELLQSGEKSDQTNKVASLYGEPFPAAGIYIFTIQEKDVDDSTITISPRLYTVIVDVKRVANDGVAEDVDLTLKNSHLEATLSKISYQEKQDGDTYSSSQVVVGNDATFTNTYEVKEVDLGTLFTVEKQFTGRPIGDWLDSDSFTFIVDGADDTTRKALENGDFALVGEFDDTSDSKSAKEFTISHDTLNHQFLFQEMDFSKVQFPVDTDDAGNHTTQPVVYYLTVREKIPTGATSGVYKGIHYSEDVYTIKITLENAVTPEGETDGIIDQITMELYKNYDYEHPESNEPFCKCVTTNSPSGEKQVVHGPKEKHNIVFSNTYSMDPVVWTPTVSKTLNGREWVAGDSFRFTITQTDSNKTGVELPRKLDLDVQPTGDDYHDGSTFQGKFQPIRFTKPGEYHFTIQEHFNSVNGIEVDASSHNITVKVVDNGEGKLVATFNDDEDANTVVNYVNTYSESGSFELSLQKTLVGRNWAQDDQFIFTIIPDDFTKTAIENGIIELPDSFGKKNTDGNYQVTISLEDGDTIDGTLTKKLGEIKFTKGEADSQKYSFTIQEELDGLEGIRCADHTVVLDMNVSRILSDVTNVPTGKLEIVATYSFTKGKLTTPSAKDEESILEVVVPFVNEYFTDPAVWTPTVSKTLTGRDWVAGDSFRFTITQKDSTQDGVILPTNLELLIQPTGDDYHEGASFQGKFQSIQFIKPGEYHFTIQEHFRDINGVEVDASSHDITVKVVDNGKGKLIASFNNDPNNNTVINYVNTYSESGSFEFSLQKTLVGRSWVQKDKFTFTIIPDELTKEAIEQGILVVPDSFGKKNANGNYQVTISLEDGESVNGTITKKLGEIKFTKGEANSKKYSFTIQEELDGLENIRCEDHTVVLDMNVSRILDKDTQVPTGKLEIVATYAFVNSKQNTPTIKDNEVVIPFVNEAYAEESISIKKLLEGYDWSDTDSYIIMARLVSNNSSNIEFLDKLNYDEIVLTKDNTKTDLKLRFYKAGVYIFEIKEQIPDHLASGYFYDEGVYLVTLTVKDDGAGKLVVTKTIMRQDQDEAIEEDEVVFTNRYFTGDLVVSNEITGKAGDKERYFTFMITLSDRSISGEYGEMEFHNGVASVILKDGESSTAISLPSGISYEVVELEANQDGYTTTHTAETGTIPKNSQAKVKYINQKGTVDNTQPDVPNTGDSIFHWLKLTLVAMTMIFTCVFLGYKLNSKKER